MHRRNNFINPQPKEFAMTKTLRTMDFGSVLFGASIVILAITVFLGSASITKNSIQKKERMKNLEGDIDYLMMEVDYLEQRIDEMMLRIKSRDNEAGRVFERLFDEMITHGSKATDK